MANKAGVLRKNPDVVTRVIEDETILLPIYKDSDEINCIYTLNESASQLWGMINGARTADALKKLAAKKFDARPEEVSRKVDAFIKELKSIKAIK